MGNIEKEIEDFLLDIECLDRLKPWIDSQNIFDILKLSTQEIRHSNFLAWLFDPNESHSFGDKIIKDVVCKLVRENREQCENMGFDSIKMMLLDYSSFKIYREREHIDLLMVSDSEKTIFCFENKVFSGEHDTQLSRYMKKVDEMYRGYKTMYIFLTPDGLEASEEEWLILSYRELIKIIIDNKEKTTLSTQEQVYIDNYINTVRRSIMQDEELSKVCSEIYYKHKKALDLIFENIPDASNDLFDSLKSVFKNYNVGNQAILDSYGATKTYIRFNTQYTSSIFPKFIDGRISNWNTPYRTYYEIINKKDRWILQFAMNSGNINDEERAFCEKVTSILDKGKTLKKNWVWKTFNISRNLLPSNIEEMTDEEIENDKDNILDSVIKEIFRSIKVFEEKLIDKNI